MTDHLPSLTRPTSSGPASPPRPTSRRWTPCASRRWARPASISALLKSLGAMSPDERRDRRAPRSTACATASPPLIADAQGRAGGRRAGRPARRRPARPHPARAAAPQGLGASDHAGDGRDDRHLRRDGLRRRRGPGHRGRLPQLHGPELPAPPPGAGDARHLLPSARTRDGERKLLRTHTSPVQVRTMQRTNAPPARRGSPSAASRRSASSRPAAPIAATATPPTPRCSTRSRGW